LFGPMVDDPSFSAFLVRNIARGTAFCARTGPTGSLLSGAIVLRVADAPRYEISWLAVRASQRSAGVGTSLLATALCRHAKLPCTVSVVTFGPDHPGRRALHFYERLGFKLIGRKPDGPDGGSRVELQLTLPEMPWWSALAQRVTDSVP
jgi:ribosomal protein S18 acetylase RimI-like enzyme